jgi:hypothetical protein
MPFYPSALSALVAVSLIVFLLIRRRRATVRLGSTVFLIFAMFGAVLLVYRLRGLAFERDVLRLQAGAAVSAEVARGFLRLRDYANTPIQTIVFATALLRRSNPDLEPILLHINRATARLMELSRALKSYESMNNWNPGDRPSDRVAPSDRAATADSPRNRAA